MNEFFGSHWTQIMEFFDAFGFGGLIFLIWYLDYRKINSLRMVIEKYGKLSEQYHSLSSDLQTVVIMNTEAITKLNERLAQLLTSGRRK